jgi:aldehyde dehydrogenase (NAD+)
MSTVLLNNKLNAVKQFFNSGETHSYEFRKKLLQKLRSALLKYEKDIHDALYTDLKKSPEESWITETGFVLSEINSALKNLRRWMYPERVKTNLINFPSSSYILREPLGVVLIIAPWNYPVQLLFTPLIGAIAAGNCIVLKPSEFAPATSAILKKIIEETFSQEYILYVEGDGAEIVPALINNFRFDHIFYTGSTSVGKIIYKMAAEQLVPVTLELGGKSPCIVESDANIQIAARRIALPKFSNAGQMCVAPDYVLVHQSAIEKFINALKRTLIEFYSEDAFSSYGYCKIINEKQFNRIINYLNNGTIVYGGRYDASTLCIEPTIIENILPDSPIMKEEIFGPVLPVISYKNFEEAKSIIDQNPNPLALYIYTTNKKKEKEWLSQIPAGSVCVNNSSWQLTNPYLPFGGRGNSGIGQYHGKNSFETFSHRKAVLKTPLWFDPKIKYPPFKGKLWLFKKIVR